MRSLFYLFSCLFLFSPSLLFANEDGSVLAAVSRAVTDEKWDEASRLFKIAIAENRAEAENFFWRESVCDSFRRTMAVELGDYYKKYHNHEKARVFYSELIKISPQDINSLSKFADMQICCGKEEEALETYEKILAIDSNSLSANIFIGNYYFFNAEKTKKNLDNAFTELVSPTRMQYATYKNRLFNLLNTQYTKSKQYLEKVVSSFPSAEIQKTLDKIKMVEAEINK